MTRDEMMGLKPLDIIRHKTNADAFIVHRVSVDMLREGMAVTGHKIRVTAVRVIEATNPDEWDKVAPGGEVLSS